MSKEVIFEQGDVKLFRRSIPDVILQRSQNRMPVVVEEQLEIQVGGWDLFAALAVVSELQALAGDLERLSAAALGAVEAIKAEIDVIKVHE